MLEIIIYLIAGYIIVYYCVPLLFKFKSRHTMMARIRKNGLCCLTFDDGPNPHATEKILDILKKHGIKATFFVSWKNAANQFYLLEKIKTQGHEIGDHGYAHCHSYTLNPIKYVSDLWKSQQTQKRLMTGKIKYFRPTYGKITLVTMLYLLITRKVMVFWSIDPKDYRINNGEKIAEGLLNEIDKPGVILLHDGRIHEINDVEGTIKGLSMFLERVQTKNICFATISEAMSQ